jgi:hypothetical protein
MATANEIGGEALTAARVTASADRRGGVAEQPRIARGRARGAGRGDRIATLSEQAAYLLAAREVASEFWGASNAVRDPVVAAAYADLEAQMDRLFARFTGPRVVSASGWCSRGASFRTRPTRR